MHYGKERRQDLSINTGMLDQAFGQIISRPEDLVDIDTSEGHEASGV